MYILKFLPILLLRGETGLNLQGPCVQGVDEAEVKENLPEEVTFKWALKFAKGPAM